MTAPHYNVQHGMSYQPPAASSGFGSAGDWATILSGLAQGAQGAMRRESATPLTTGKKSAREAKRRTLASILESAFKRHQGLEDTNQVHENELRDFQSQTLQNAARGFVGGLR